MIARGVRFLLPLLPLVALACGGSQSKGTTQTTSARSLAAGSPNTRTVDNAGYVDPGGRTRQVSAGAAPAPVGRGAAVAPTRPESPGGVGVAPSESRRLTPPPADATEFNERAARALCDRETFCDRIGASKRFESEGACMADKRDRVRSALGEAACDEIRGDRVASCLTAIRGAACGEPRDRQDPPVECGRTALCGVED